MKYITNFINKKRNISNKYTSKEIVTSLIVISIILYIEKINIVYCGSTSTELAITQLQEFIRTLTDEEVEEFAYRIQFQLNPGVQHDIEQPAQSTGWQSVAIFIVATTVLFVISRYGEA